MKKKPSRNTGKKSVDKPNPTIPVENPSANHIAGLDGNQLLKAINKDGDETLMKLCVSSAMHERAQDQVNRSSLRLQEKAEIQLKTCIDCQNTDMEGIIAGPSRTTI